MINIYEGVLDIKNMSSNFRPFFIQYDNAILKIKLQDNEKVLDISDATKVQFTHELRNGLVIVRDGAILNAEEGLIEYRYNGIEMNLIGDVYTTVTLFDDYLEKLTTPTFIVKVKKDPNNNILNPKNPESDVIKKMYEEIEIMKELNGIPGPEGPQGPEGPEGPQGKQAEVSNSLDDNSIDIALAAAKGKELKRYVDLIELELLEKTQKLQEVESNLLVLNNKISDQRTLNAEFFKKLMKKENVKIITQGTSMTYGQDTTSSDKVNPTGKTDNGVPHTITRASVTYPMALQEYLSEVYGNQNLVINKGFSGDWASASFDHWNKNDNADLAIVELGTNDSNLGASWVPNDVKGNIVKYMDNLRKIIERYTKWRTAVVLVTPPRLQNQEVPTTTNGHNTEPFRLAMKLIGQEYGCIVVDSENFFNGCNNSYYSDTVHFNSKGYRYFASRMMSVLIGYGLENFVKINSGDTLSIRSTRDNFVNNGVILTTATGSLAAEENAIGQGLLANITPGNNIFYSFETVSDNMILIPIYSVSNGGKFKATLDFGNEQGSIPLLSAAHRNAPQGFKPLSVIESTVNTNNNTAYNGNINIDTTDRYIHITNKGLHVIKVENSANAGNLFFNGFVCIGFNEFLKLGSGGGTTAKSNFLKVNIAGGSTSTSSYDLTIQNLKNNFEMDAIVGEYYKSAPIKIILSNYTTNGAKLLNIIEYAFIWNDTTADGTQRNGFLFLGEIKKYDNGSPDNFRTINNVNYNFVNGKYEIIFGGNLSCYSNIMVTFL